MPDEKYLGYCSRCADHPPFFKDDSISNGLCYNPWCLFCNKIIGEKNPTSFWPKGQLGRFSFECECGDYKTPSDKDTASKFGQSLVDHFFNEHKMYISAALIMVSHILGEKVIPKYLVPNPERQ